MTAKKRPETEAKEHVLSIRTTFDITDQVKRSAREAKQSTSEYLNNVLLKHYRRG